MHIAFHFIFYTTLSIFSTSDGNQHGRMTTNIPRALQPSWLYHFYLSVVCISPFIINSFLRLDINERYCKLKAQDFCKLDRIYNHCKYFLYKKLIFLIFFSFFELKASFIFDVLTVLAFVLYGYQILMIIICMLMLISTSNWMWTINRKKCKVQNTSHHIFLEKDGKL